MNVATITMPADQAKAKLEEYREGLRRRSDDEYSAAVVAYEQLAKGHPILILSEAIATAPRDARMRPMLAIARADRRQVRYSRYRGHARPERFDSDFQWKRGRAVRDAQIDVPILPATPHALPPGNPARPWLDDECVGYALVPMVPPAVQKGHDLSKRFILWEVEAWAERPLIAQPDRDPYLLVRIAPDCFAVVGEWDLTDVERAVMRGRAGA